MPPDAMHNRRDTIAAISTPHGVGAVGMIRISGPLSRAVMAEVWINPSHPVNKFVSHRLYYGKISTVGGGVIDNVLCSFMAGPNSYTGEDVVEIFCHGGAYSTKAVLEAIFKSGARAAEPGEFTKRSFLNGKMDLAQAEAVAEVISATSERALKIANEHLSGRLSNIIKGLQEELKQIKAFVEATIDFPEEDIEFIEHEQVVKKLTDLSARLRGLISTYNEGRLICDGVRVALVGRPNVGKSSILNRLLGHERAIVHHTPGTTRDTIEASATFGGALFHLVDTAGLRDASCEIEQLGIERAREKISGADLVLVILDASLSDHCDNEKLLEETKVFRRLIVANKIDVGTSSCHTGVDLNVSAKTGEGISELVSALTKFALTENSTSESDIVITSQRHKNILERTIESLNAALETAGKKESAEFIALHLQNAMSALGEITGEVTPDAVLNEIFSKFCIGK